MHRDVLKKFSFDRTSNILVSAHGVNCDSEPKRDTQWNILKVCHRIKPHSGRSNIGQGLVKFQGLGSDKVQVNLPIPSVLHFVMSVCIAHCGKNQQLSF